MLAIHNNSGNNSTNSPHRSLQSESLTEGTDSNPSDEEQQQQLYQQIRQPEHHTKPLQHLHEQSQPQPQHHYQNHHQQQQQYTGYNGDAQFRRVSASTGTSGTDTGTVAPASPTPTRRRNSHSLLLGIHRNTNNIHHHHHHHHQNDNNPNHYLEHRFSRRIVLESTASEVEMDPKVQQQQRAMLQRMNQRLAASSSHRRGCISFPSCFQNCNVPIFVCSMLTFLAFVGAGIGVALSIRNSREQDYHDEALTLALEGGQYIAEQLDRSLLPLYSMAEFATHLSIFQLLPQLIGMAGEPDALPLSTDTWKRNVTGICDQPELIETFVDIATGITHGLKAEGSLSNVQLAPNGVVCLMHPERLMIDENDMDYNNYEYNENMTVDNTLMLGLDLFNLPSEKEKALDCITGESVDIMGPIELSHQYAKAGEKYFVGRLPVVDESNWIYVRGRSYPRWGFVTIYVEWTQLVQESGIYDVYFGSKYEFQLTRTDQHLNKETLDYDETIVVLAESPGYEKLDAHYVQATFENMDGEWTMTVAYDRRAAAGKIGMIIVISTVVALAISVLVFIVLSQKHVHGTMLAESSAQDAKVNTERNMTAYFAHELRNPLSALDSALSSITSEDLPANTKELLDGMQLCSSFMSSIMNNLLDVRKIEEGKMRIRSRPLSLSSLVEDTHKMMKSSVRPGVEFLTRIDVPKDRNWVLGDAHRIQQVLTNVVTNAIKYTLEGSITLTVTWKQNHVQLECIDTGPGIPVNEQTRLFERFVQRGGAPGTGLGLNIALQIVNMMKGVIGFESDPTVKPGTTCRILLPLSLCTEPDESTTLRESSPMQPLEEEIEILIIDDIKMNRMMLERRIKKAIAPKSKITMAETAEKALEICKTKEFDIIICDQYMEEAGGVLVGTDAIIAMRRNKVKSLIIGCSGNDLEADFIQSGADVVWGKPMPSNAEIISQWRDGLFARRIERTSIRNQHTTV